ncbi:MAG: lipopolysaccharide biosynthesis protein [Alphaproteobacteria bacterium]
MLIIFLPFIAFTLIFNDFFTTIVIYQRKLRKFYLFKILSMSIFFMFNGMTLYLLTFIDKFLIQKYMTYYDLGTYGLSVTIIGSILVLTATFLHIIIKIKINENIKSEEKLSQIRFFSNNLINILIVPILMGFAIYGYNFLILYAGDNFSQSYQYTVILLIVVYFNLIMYFYSQKYFLQNKQKAIKIMFKITVFVLIINIITIPRYGLMGATFSSVIASLLQYLAII